MSDQAKKAKTNSKGITKAKKPLEHSDPIRNLNKTEAKGKTGVKLGRNDNKNKNVKRHQNQDDKFPMLYSEMDVANSRSD